MGGGLKLAEGAMERLPVMPEEIEGPPVCNCAKEGIGGSGEAVQDAAAGCELNSGAGLGECARAAHPTPKVANEVAVIQTRKNTLVSLNMNHLPKNLKTRPRPSPRSPRSSYRPARPR